MTALAVSWSTTTPLDLLPAVEPVPFGLTDPEALRRWRCGHARTAENTYSSAHVQCRRCRHASQRVACAKYRNDPANRMRITQYKTLYHCCTALERAIARAEAAYY